MSLGVVAWPSYNDSFPRVSGDEPPASAEAMQAAEFSPRERG